MQVELLLNDHWCLYVLMDAYSVAFLDGRVPILHILRTNRETFVALLLGRHLLLLLLLLLLLGVIVRCIYCLLEGLSVLRTLLADDLVHVSSGTVDNARLGDAVRAAAALHARALARLIGHDGRTLLHRFLTQLQKVEVSKVGLAPVDGETPSGRSIGDGMAQPPSQLRRVQIVSTLLVAR